MKMNENKTFEVELTVPEGFAITFAEVMDESSKEHLKWAQKRIYNEMIKINPHLLIPKEVLNEK